MKRKDLLANIKKDLENATARSAAVYEAYKNVADENYQLRNEIMDLEARWPRDLAHGGKIYGDVYTAESPLKKKPATKHQDDIKRGLRTK